MSPRTQLAHQRLVDKIVSEARKKTKGKLAKTAVKFVRRYYRHAPTEDIADVDPGDLAAAALSLWKFGAVRPRRTLLLRAFNPIREQNGWSSSHTIIEVVNNDMPFIVDSIINELSRKGIPIHLVVHPVVRVKRLINGTIVRLLPASVDNEIRGVQESYIHIEISQQTSSEGLQAIVDGLKRVLGDVRAAVDDWSKMRARVASVLAELDADPPPLPDHELEESKEFLRWLDQGHFTFLGYREYRFRRRKKRMKPEVVPNSGLGLFRRDERRTLDGLRDHDALPGDVEAFVEQPRLLLISKGPQKATVHRNVHLDMIGVKQFNDRDQVVGEKLFVGLFSSAAYNRSLQYIPLLRRRIKQTVKEAGLHPSSHDGKMLLHILETFPRDDLFQISDEALLDVSTGILNLRERSRTALFLWLDPFERFVSCLIYVPLDRHHTVLRRRIQHLLEEAYQGKCRSFDTKIDQGSILARIHFVIETTPHQVPVVDPVALEQRVAEAARSWSDKLKNALIAAEGMAAGLRLLGRYEEAFDGAYEQTYDADTAVIDVAQIEQVLASDSPGLYLYRRGDQAEDEVQFRVYHLHQPVPLSDALPILENLGFKAIAERPFQVRPDGCPTVWIHDFALVHRDGVPIDLDAIGAPLREAVARVWLGQMEDDGFNRLVVASRLSWRQVVLLRAFARFLRQAQIAYSESYMQDTLARNPRLASSIVQLFEEQFDPAKAGRDAAAINSVRKAIERGLDDVTSLDEDRIISRFVNAVEATLRTNFYQNDETGRRKAYVSIKLDSRAIESLPSPRPMVEIFVYSPEVEGVHLRFGKVARGGLRWSDRREDYRTEILGLVKAQQVKNAVIVPVGSKGGFVVKRPPADGARDAMLQAGITCYQTFIRGMLDLTDNYSNGAATSPTDVVCKDEEDPYLVVAADKGTASFSDIANEVAEAYDFWLGDAFASGGSAGYDHKKMGITARGTWESVKRHFRELGKDIQKEDFTVVGVGDMSGDVFGNGMLLSQHIELIGAFNHLHIFVDPDPNPKASHRERKRLFQLERSSWSDYDRSVLSEGGAIYDRNAKSIALSPAVKKRFSIGKTRVTPNTLIRAIIRAKADLLFFGGIGTYVKSRRENHADVGDRANDSIRIDANRLRVKVIGEGANLGLTQLGRVEFALEGGRINTDSVDNSAGVDCSDHEVNIKILLGAVEHSGKLTRRQRNNLLEKMTDEVGELVLNDNYLQTGSLSVTEFIEHRLTDRMASFMRSLERAGHLDRAIEFLPDDETLADRKARGQGLTRPELCILMAYAKLVLYNELLESDFPDEPIMTSELGRYFPVPLRKKYESWIVDHRLQREIIATMTTNSIVNRAGITFAHEVMEKTGKKACDVARGYAICRKIFDMRELWEEIDALDNLVPASLQAAMHRETGRLIERATTWFLNHGTQPLDIAVNIENYGAGVHHAVETLDSMLTESDREYLRGKTARFVEQGAPESLARRVANLRMLVSACDIVRVSRDVSIDVERAGKVYFAVGEQLDIDWLRRQAAGLPVESHWDSQATTSIVEDLYHHQFLLTRKMLRHAGPIDDPADIVANCCTDARAATSKTIQEIRQSGKADLAMLAVANRQLSMLAVD